MDGLRIMKTTRVGEELDAARRLEAIETAEAAKSQRAVLNGLRLVLGRLEETQGVIGSDREALLDLVRELSKRQGEIRDKTREADLARPEAAQLVEAQTALQKDLGKLAEGLSRAPAALKLLEQAKSAAFEATGRLFDQSADAALREEGKVLASLAGIEEALASVVCVKWSGHKTSLSRPEEAMRQPGGLRARVRGMNSRGNDRQRAGIPRIKGWCLGRCRELGRWRLGDPGQPSESSTRLHPFLGRRIDV